MIPKVKRKRLGSVLRCYRVMKEMGFRELAEEVGVSAATLCRIESGKAMDADTLLKLLNWMLR